MWNFTTLSRAADRQENWTLRAALVRMLRETDKKPWR